MKDTKLVVAAALAAASFTTVWLWRAAVDEKLFLDPAPIGQPVIVEDVEYRLVSLLAKDQVDVGSNQIVAEEGAVLVLAELRYDATRDPDGLYCSFELVAGELHWRPEYGYYPPKPASISCNAGESGTVSALFEVPRKLVGQVQGVSVRRSGGGPAPVLGGRPS